MNNAHLIKALDWLDKKKSELEEAVLDLSFWTYKIKGRTEEARGYIREILKDIKKIAGEIDAKTKELINHA